MKKYIFEFIMAVIVLAATAFTAILYTLPTSTSNLIYSLASAAGLWFAILMLYYKFSSFIGFFRGISEVFILLSLGAILTGHVDHLLTLFVSICIFTFTLPSFEKKGA